MNEELRGAIENAFSYLRTDTYLNNHIRFDIYRVMGPVSEDGIFHPDPEATVGVRRRVHLGLLESKRVLPVWQARYPGNLYPANRIRDVEQALAGKTDRRTFVAGIGDFDLVGGDSTPESLKAYRAAVCAYRMVTCCLIDWKDGLEIDWLNDPDVGDLMERHTVDWDLSDCALWACNVESSPYHKEDYDPEASLKYWRWWLTEAVPQAYAAVESV